MTIDFSKLEEKIAALTVIVANVKKDYADMLALIAELEAVVAGTDVQAKVDALAEQIGFSVAEIAATEASFPVPPAV